MHHTGQVGVRLGHTVADANGVGLSRDAAMADDDVVTPGGEVLPGALAQSDVVLTSGNV